MDAGQVRWARVRAWRDRLRSAPLPPTNLSPAGLALIRDLALDALADDVLDRVAAMSGAPYPSASFVAARTALTAPIEWLAVLLGRGTQVHLKVPRGDPGLGPWLTQHAVAEGLPLTCSDALTPAPLVVVMGSDNTVREVQASMPESTRVLGFGHRFSAAWSPWGEDPAPLATDLAAHDGRGCMTPAVVFTDDLRQGEALAAAMAEAEARWPRGAISDAESAALRSREALARVTGKVWAGSGWSVHALPASRWSPVSLPRSAQLVVTTDAQPLLAPWLDALSTLGSTAPRAAPDHVRLTTPGQMQAPPVERHHDGVDWLRATLA